MKGKALTIILLIILIILFAFTTFNHFSKENIHEATSEEIAKVDGISYVLSNRIEIYLINNKSCTVNDLEDVDGIGEQRLKKIKRRYK